MEKNENEYFNISSKIFTEIEWSSEKFVADLPLLANVELLPQMLLLVFRLFVVVSKNFLLGLPKDAREAVWIEKKSIIFFKQKDK